MAAVALAIAAAILGPANPDWQVALPSAPSGLLAALESWAAAPRRPAAAPVPHDEDTVSTCSCEYPAAERCEPATLAWAFVAGFAAWPLVDVFRLIKLAWQREVLAPERSLQMRPPDRP